MTKDRALSPAIAHSRVVWTAVVFFLLAGSIENSAASRREPIGTPMSAASGTQDSRSQERVADASDEPRQSPAGPTWAFVQGLPIGDGEVRFLLGRLDPATTGQRAALDAWLADAAADAPTERPALPSEVVQATVEQWIERLVVLAFLERQQMASSPERVAAELETLDKQLRELGSSLPAYCGKSGIRREALERHLQWELSWNRYVVRRVTDESLEKFFDLYPAEFDGRRRRVAHIALLWDTAADDGNIASADGDVPASPPTIPWPRPLPAGAAERIEALEQVRQRIVAGDMTFAEAAAQYSQGASAADGGDLGWTLRAGPLSEAVSQVAFRLKMGEISPPIVSPHGVHLLMVLAEEPGQRSFEQVKEQVKQVAIGELWQTILRQESPRLSIEFRPPQRRKVPGN